MVAVHKLAWLAGLWDGEGSITMFVAQERNKAPKIIPTLVLVNTNAHIVNEALNIISEIGARFHVFERPENKKHKACFQLTTRNMGHIKAVLGALIPYLVGKKPQAEMLLRYVNRRMELADKTGRTTHLGYDDDDWSMQRAVQALNRRGPEPSETKGLAASADDMVRSHDESVS